MRDVVEVAAHPTVVRLQDLESPDAAWITSTFYLTRDVAAHLDSLRAVLSRPSGSGLFLIGPYGSGKSHLLAYVTQALRAGAFVEPAPAVVAVSLLDYRAETPLEDVVARALSVEAGAPASGVSAGRGARAEHPVADRRVAFAALERLYPNGVLLVVDELSEFLRSKPDRRRFNEDVRYLQFLGERARDSRLFVLAAMQEQIEHTGDLESDLYRKIKDRYPIRYLLSSGHVRDLVKGSLLRRKPGYEAAARAVCQDVSRGFPGVLSEETLLYPLHPATLELLEEVRDRFSQARGSVDFVVTQLLGDPARGIAPFGDRPLGSLLTPDLIVDHFRDLLEIAPEFLPLAQRVFPYYERRLPELFPQKASRELAGRLLKALVLCHLSPIRKGLSPKEAAGWLLHRASRVDPAKNVEVVERHLGKLADGGPYVVREGDAFRLEPSEDAGWDLEGELRREARELADVGEGVFEIVMPLLVADGASPLSLPRETWQHRQVRWHFHERPFSVWLGGAPPESPPGEGTPLWIQLPWGHAREGGPALAPGPLFRFTPAALAVTPDLLELAALARLRSRPRGEAALSRLEKRLGERLASVSRAVRGAYVDGVLTSPQGDVESPARRETTQTLTQWLEALAERMLRRTYPTFERLAPSHGPLSKEAYRAFGRAALAGDLTSEGVEESVRLIREAYLVPMGLIRRRGREVTVPKEVDRGELVRLVMPMLASRPHPRLVYERLAEPPHGLVSDQVSLLLLFLLATGEVDLVKGRASYRESHETLPNPIQYDALVPGFALPAALLAELETLAKAAGVRIASPATVHAQRRAVRELRDAMRGKTLPLRNLLVRLSTQEGGGALASRVERLLSPWDLLSRHDDELAAFQLLADAISPASRHLAQLEDLAGLPERLGRLISDTQRFRHLLGSPALETYPERSLAVRLTSLGSPPPLDQTEALEAWLLTAREAYEAYRADYRRRHEVFWAEAGSRPALRYTPPAAARSRHLALERELHEWESARRAVEALRCRALSDLDFTPVCSCGFTGEGAPASEALERLEGLRARIESAVQLFFAQGAVRERLRAYVGEGLDASPGALAYARGEAAVPVVADLEQLDRHLAGVELVKTLDSAEVVELLVSRAWERPALMAALDGLLSRVKAPRLRFERPSRAEPSTLVRWCLEQCLRHAAPLPPGLPPEALREAAGEVEARWVGPECLRALSRLSLPEEGVRRVMSFVAAGTVAVPPADRAALDPKARAALELLSPTPPTHPVELGETADLLYRHAGLLFSVDAGATRTRLAALHAAPLPEGLPGLPAALLERPSGALLLVDALSIALLPSLLPELPSLFPAHTLASTRHALVGPETTTDACHRALVEAGLNRPVEKVDALDTLLHERRIPFEDLARLALAELRLSLAAVLPRLEGREVTVFADHGFRLAEDGRSYTHGGGSALERVVPLLLLAPR